jgi:hypothetical protein
MPRPSARLRVAGAACALAASAAALGACADRGTDRIPPAPALVTNPTTVAPTTTAASSLAGPPGVSAGAQEAGTHAVGDTVVTPGGATLVLHGVDTATAGRVGADLEVCAGPGPLHLDTDAFGLETSDGATALPLPAARQPALVGADLPAGACTRGWLAFPVEDGATPVALVFRGSTVVRWPLA